jgi:hypothetical protein
MVNQLIAAISPLIWFTIRAKRMGSDNDSQCCGFALYRSINARSMGAIAEIVASAKCIVRPQAPFGPDLSWPTREA